MIIHSVNCSVCGTIVMKKERRYKRRGDGEKISAINMLLDITPMTGNAAKYQTLMMVVFTGDRLCSFASRFREGDNVEVRFTPKCRTKENERGELYYSSYNLGFYISRAKDNSVTETY